MIDNQIMISIFVALITILITNFFNYYFAVKKEMRMQASKYKVDILEKVYTPLLQELGSQIVPGDVYEGLNSQQFGNIHRIVNSNINLIDIELERIVYSIEEDIHFYHNYRRIDDRDFSVDEDRELLNHVSKQYNLLRKNLGLPYKRMLFHRIIDFKVKIEKKLKRRRRRIKKRLLKNNESN